MVDSAMALWRSGGIWFFDDIYTVFSGNYHVRDDLGPVFHFPNTPQPRTHKKQLLHFSGTVPV